MLEPPRRAAYCVESWPSPTDRHAYAVFLLLSTYVCPIIAIIASYALIGRSLCLRSASSTPTNSITSRRPAAAAASTVGSRDGPGAVGGAGRGMALTGHGGALQGVGESWPVNHGGVGGGVAAGTLMMMPSIPGPMNASRCSREAAGVPAASGLQVPGRSGRQLSSSSSTSDSGRKKAAAAALLVAGYSAAGDGVVAGDNDGGMVTFGPAVRRRHPMTPRSIHVPTVGPYRDAINRSRRSVWLYNVGGLSPNSFLTTWVVV